MAARKAIVEYGRSRSGMGDRACDAVQVNAAAIVGAWARLFHRSRLGFATG
jgi:hypothetical protein